MAMQETLVGAALTAAAAAFGWLLHLGNRVTRLETYREEDKERLDEIRDDVKAIAERVGAHTMKS